MADEPGPVRELAGRPGRDIGAFRVAPMNSTPYRSPAAAHRATCSASYAPASAVVKWLRDNPDGTRRDPVQLHTGAGIVL